MPRFYVMFKTEAKVYKESHFLRFDAKCVESAKKMIQDMRESGIALDGRTQLEKLSDVLLLTEVSLP